MVDSRQNGRWSDLLSESDEMGRLGWGSPVSMPTSVEENEIEIEANKS